MFSVFYDFGFTGHLQIFTDNMTAMENWTKNGKNSKLALNFESVTVSFIPREKNTMADKLGRTRMIINIPTAEYLGIVAKCNSYEQLQGDKVRIELEKRAALEAKNLAENRVKDLEIQLEQYKILDEKRGFIPRWFSKLKNFFKDGRGYELLGNN
jgi:hypothetical protein